MTPPKPVAAFDAPTATALACGAYAVVVGASVLSGWALDLPRLTDWTGQGISMFPNAAICALFTGGALILLGSGEIEPRRIPIRILAGLAILIAALTLWEHVAGHSLGIDTLVFDRPWGQAAAVAPMRMGVPASTSFVILGVAVFLATFAAAARVASTALALAAVAIASLSLTGYWFGANQLFGIARFTGISLLTSTVVAALSIGIMAAVAEHGVVSALRRDDAGGVVLRRLLVPVILIPPLVGWLRLMGERAGLYDSPFGTAIRTLVEIVLFFAFLWWTANTISRHAFSAQNAQSRLAAIIDTSDDAIISKTLDGIVESWNAGATRIFGYSAAEAVGKHISLIIPSDRLGEEAEILARLKRGERIEHYETVRQRKNGDRISISLTVSPLKDANGCVVGASKIARDVTERNRYEREREELLESERSARGDAERASQLKDEFLATLSHELRTPLNAILGWSQLLTMDHDPAELEQGLDAIQRNARAQTQLIEDLLDMSRIISGKVRLNVQLTELATVIDAAVDSVQPSANAKEIKLRRIIDPHAGQISGDPDRLQQVVWNLLSNAIKFTPKGGKIDVLLERVNSHLELTVHDSGIGIKPEFLSVVFERFRQADSSSTRSFGGLGLGLSIVKHLIELHGGTVQATSAGEGQGATFVVSLPLAPIRDGATREHRTTSRAAVLECADLSLKGVRVLVIDDEFDARTLLSSLLLRCEAEVLTASNGDEGLQALGRYRPDVLVSDIGMPGKDGYQLIREIRELDPEKGGKVPAIALTAFARSEDRTRAMIAGFHVHVAKPIDPRELIATIANLAGRTN